MTTTTQPRTDWLYDLGPADYRMAKEALQAIAEHRSSPARIFGLRLGTRQQWAAIVEAWEQFEKQADGPIAHLIIWADGMATAWTGDLAAYQDQDPLPWESAIA